MNDKFQPGKVYVMLQCQVVYALPGGYSALNIFMQTGNFFLLADCIRNEKRISGHNKFSWTGLSKVKGAMGKHEPVRQGQTTTTGTPCATLCR